MQLICTASHINIFSRFSTTLFNRGKVLMKTFPSLSKKIIPVITVRKSPPPLLFQSADKVKDRAEDKSKLNPLRNDMYLLHLYRV